MRVAGGPPVPVYVAAMGPKALQVSGGLADGTLPYLAGPRTMAEFVQPAIAKSAVDSGQPKPTIIASVPAVASDNVDAAKTLNAERRLNLYETIPSCQQVIA
jgi:alkanesulfonate monooxygenase SsuD/methylene tetrahydromethanopterin reductase-like flavin-dependent oxidoreductase (luciferase family)